MNKNLGILIANLGTPAAPTAEAVHTYLAEFLSDPRVIQLPKWLWQPILHGIILRRRPERSAAAYKKIWTSAGSPLLVISQQQTKKLIQLIEEKKPAVKISLGMRYGEPSILSALTELKAAKINKLLVLPLYPQYSHASTASIFDAVENIINTWPAKPEIRRINSYANNASYITAIANSIKSFWQIHPPGDKLLFSFHGLPKNSIAQGDPYYHECLTTSELIAKELQLPPQRWQTVFQSRFGLQKWLQPYCDQTLIALGKQGASVDVVCPGFAADCLETLEEIAIQNKARFINVGGKHFNYIPALNDSLAHIEMLFQLIEQEVSDWF